MGFSEALATRALQETKNASAELAMNCILENQSKWEKEPATSSSTPAAPSSGGANGSSSWRSLTDLNTGREYYHNDTTGETTWTKPAGMSSGNAQPAAASGGGGGDDELMQALAMSQREEEERQARQGGGSFGGGYPGAQQPSSYSSGGRVVSYKVVHPKGVGYRRSANLSDKIMDRRGPTPGDVVRGDVEVGGSDGLDFVKCDNGLWLPMAIYQEGRVVPVLKQIGGGGDGGAAMGGMDEDEALRLAMQMSMADAQPVPAPRHAPTVATMSPMQGSYDEAGQGLGQSQGSGSDQGWG